MKNFFIKHKVPISIVAAIALIVTIVLSGFAISEAAYRTESDVEMAVPTELEYNWSSADEFDITDERYPTIRSKEGNIKILQLTDVHFKNSGNFGSEIGTLYITDGMMKRQVKDLVKLSQPDLIVITGDLITYSGAQHAYKEFIRFIDNICEKYSCKWTIVFGNHDSEYSLNKVALSMQIKQAKHSLFDMGPTNFAFDSTKVEGEFDDIEWRGMTGLGNFVIKVSNEQGEIKQALILMDSNDWVRGQKEGRQYSTYQAGFYPMQIMWYEWVCQGLKKYNGGTEMRTTFYSHIAPFRKEKDSTNETEIKLNSDCLTKLTYDGVTYDIHESIKNQKSTKVVFFGHTHYQGFTYKDPKSDIYYVNVNKTGYNYNDYAKKTGGTLAELNVNGESYIWHYHNKKMYDKTTIE